MATPSSRQSKGHFPPDLAVVLGFPGAAIFFVFAFSLPRVPRTILFVLLGIALLVLGVRLVQERRLLWYLYGGLYIVIGVGMFYLAYVATLFV